MTKGIKQAEVLQIAVNAAETKDYNAIKPVLTVEYNKKIADGEGSERFMKMAYKDWFRDGDRRFKKIEIEKKSETEQNLRVFMNDGAMKTLEFKLVGGKWLINKGSSPD
ncbi:MAG: hypothetical protein AAB263_13445 [Planctomycetota bacterium]